MKSALELAMEKSDEILGDEKDQIKLRPGQIEAIDEIKKQYEARWAEQEIVLRGKIEKMAREVDPRTLAEHQSQFQREMNEVREKIFAERDRKIEEIRRRKP